ncbi:hypothetical protein BST27_11405 [Mycobacterium intermedium]|uniref:Uncharacterized protein n=1 Tax=Mycobacterium intermedium TaxID=28445 RepID=A0A1T3WBK5_MYCIE|nr:hypothetical protein BV508_05470 [Mycobacterium intermedium]ORB06100.1 hypothetical protein BST27_11405 [Mycobacterium intermedium]
MQQVAQGVVWQRFSLMQLRLQLLLRWRRPLRLRHSAGVPAWLAGDRGARRTAGLHWIALMTVGRVLRSALLVLLTGLGVPARWWW